MSWSSKRQRGRASTRLSWKWTSFSLSCLVGLRAVGCNHATEGNHNMTWEGCNQSIVLRDANISCHIINCVHIILYINMYLIIYYILQYIIILLYHIIIHNLDRVALSTVTTVPTTLLSHCLAHCSEASVAGQQTRLPLLPHWCSYQQSHRWIPHLTKSSAILFGSVEQKVEQEPHQLTITSIKYLSNIMKLYEMNMRCTYLVPSLFPVAWIPWDLPHTAWVPASILSVSILISWGGAPGARRTKSGNLHLHSSPFAFDSQKMQLLKFQQCGCSNALNYQHSHWNIWSRVCVPSSINLGSGAPYFPLKMSWHKPEATARVLGEVGGLYFCAWSKFKFTHTKNLDIRGTRSEYLLLTTSHKYVFKKCKERL